MRLTALPSLVGRHRRAQCETPRRRFFSGWAAVSLLSLLAVGCGEGPIVELSVRGEAVDSISISGQLDDGTVLPPRAAPRQEAAIELLLPDRFVGRELTLTVDGLEGGQVSLTSSTSVRVVKGRVQASLVLERMDVALVCGDGILSVGEACDDQNDVVDDGCSRCVIDQGWGCVGEPSVCEEVPPDCGNGQLNAPEQCDDGNLMAGDGCSALCSIEMGWTCPDPLGPCVEIMSVCGDGMIEVGEGCDDGNLVPADGCSVACQIESGWQCMGEPSRCTEEAQLCPNGNVELGETCDDNNMVDGDGCNTNCQEESGWLCYGRPSMCEQEGYAVLVDPGGMSCPFGGGDGTRADPYCTLQEAAGDSDVELVIMVEGLHQGKSDLSGSEVGFEVVGDGRVVLASGMKDTVKVKMGAQVVLRNLIISGVNGTGGGIKVEMGGVLTLDGCTVGPSAEIGIEVKGTGDLTVLKSRIINNEKGGAVVDVGSHRFENTIVANNGNDVEDVGGLWFIKAGANSGLMNVTVADNVSKDDKQAGVRCEESLPIVNTIIWNNYGDSGSGVDDLCDASYSLFQTQVPGTGNQVGDPMFIGTDYHLDPAVIGPAIDNGINDQAPIDDIDGQTRPLGLGVDIGADEAR